MEIIVNQKSAENFQRQVDQLPDFREQTALHMGYNKISRIMSGYLPPDGSRLTLLDRDTPKEHDALLQIGEFRIGDLHFDILEGSGGHLYGEMVYVCREAGIVLTGDILVNISGFSRERAEYNSLAPYLMKSVNVDSTKAREMRQQTMALVQETTARNSSPCIVCGGHGPLFILQDGRMKGLEADIIESHSTAAE